jgi:rubrerythrin
MSDPLTDRQRRVLDRVESAPADADLDDIETLVEVACRRPEAEGADAQSAIGRVASERPALLTERVDSVLPLFAVDDPNIRWGAANIVATLAKADPERLAGTTAITNVQQAIVDPEGWNRAHAAEVLSEVAIASPELVDDELLPTLARRLESEAFPDARAQIALLFGRIARAEPGLLDDHDEFIQAAIEKRLGEDDEIESSLENAADAIAEANTSAEGGSDRERGTTAFCPACGTELTTDPTPNFCRNCGQEL